MWGWLLGCIAGFFVFSLVFQVLFNNIVVEYLGLFKSLSYLQAAGLWFLATMTLGWLPLIGAIVRRPWGRLPERFAKRLKPEAGATREVE
jgi:hypothetical protein